MMISSVHRPYYMYESICVVSFYFTANTYHCFQEILLHVQPLNHIQLLQVVWDFCELHVVKDQRCVCICNTVFEQLFQHSIHFLAALHLMFWELKTRPRSRLDFDIRHLLRDFFSEGDAGECNLPSLKYDLESYLCEDFSICIMKSFLLLCVYVVSLKCTFK